MSKQSTHSPRFQIIRRLWKPAVVTGAGGSAAAAVWFEEIMRYGEEILALIFLPIMATGIYLLDIFMFKSRTPRAEDTKKVAERGDEG